MNITNYYNIFDELDFKIKNSLSKKINFNE